MEKLAPGVLPNVLFHGAMVALAPVIAFFMLNWLGFSDVWCAVVAVLFVHVGLGSFIYRSFKEEETDASLKLQKAD